MSENENRNYQDVLHFFSKAASENDGYYDNTDASDAKRHGIFQRINRRHIDAAIQSVTKDTPLTSCLDAGCGMGDFTNHLSKTFKFDHVHGVDFSQQMLHLAKRDYAQIEALSFSQQDLSKGLAFADNSFDIALCLNVLHHILPEDQKRLAQELCRVSKHSVIIEIKHRHLAHSILTGYKAFGFMNIFATTTQEISPYFQDVGYELVKTHPIFYFKLLSPIVVLVFQKVM